MRKNRKFLISLLTCDIKVLRQMVAEHMVKPEVLKAVDEAQ